MTGDDTGVRCFNLNAIRFCWMLDAVLLCTASPAPTRSWKMLTQDVLKLAPLQTFLYWSRERHAIHLRRLAGLPRPWTDDVHSANQLLHEPLPRERQDHPCGVASVSAIRCAPIRRSSSRQ